MSEDVVATFYAEASAAMDQLSRQVVLLAEQFRQHTLPEAQAGLASVTGELRQFAVMVDVLRGPLAVAPERLQQQGQTIDEQMTAIVGHLEALIAAQDQEDWVAVADVLELDLGPALNGWGPLLRSLASAVPA
jgi:hypothetical protein